MWHRGGGVVDSLEIPNHQVIDVSKQYMGDTLATAYNDPRLTLVRWLAVCSHDYRDRALTTRIDPAPHTHAPQIVDDAAKFISQEGHEMYDVIVVDSSDPVGTCVSSRLDPPVLLGFT